jgi:hypothetical protein
MTNRKPVRDWLGALGWVPERAVNEGSLQNAAQSFRLIASAHFRIDQITAFVLRHSWAC